MEGKLTIHRGRLRVLGSTSRADMTMLFGGQCTAVLVQLANAGYRVVAPDQRGYNLSDKPSGVESYCIERLTADIRELIRVCGRERAVIVAHDWGGAVAWRFAMDYASAVEALVVMNAPHPAALARELNTNWRQRARSWYMFSSNCPGCRKRY